MFSSQQNSLFQSATFQKPKMITQQICK